MPARKLIRVLTRIGFQIVSRQGSHVKLRHPDGRSTIVPVHFLNATAPHSHHGP
ncbi:MAG TPA: type II toxin-antitoxin system HicA family toxin [Candidatus Thermoplasmatota archaeon]|nr:type II toxin-antitoxin system HicA family toxin [Candidatus Thermoplasmatota archaeon]